MRAGFSARSGGVSSAYGPNSLNLDWKDDDEKTNVAENRRRFLRAIAGDGDGGRGFSLVTVRQVHADEIQVVRSGDGALATDDGRAVLEGDGLITDVPQVMLGIQVADCVPVLVADVQRRVVGAFHAGWRGTLAQIVERGIDRMRTEYGSRPTDLIAAVGPSIGPCCYSVGDEVRGGFVERFDYGSELFREVRRCDGKKAETGEAGVGSAIAWNEAAGVAQGEALGGTQVFLDLWEANRRQLIGAGIPADAVTVLCECTACARDERGAMKYFSHRAEQGFTGRMMGAIGVTEARV